MNRKIVTLVGARPQFIKASAFSYALRNYSNVEEILVHSGQHYDENMSDVFFSELGITPPKYYLGAGSSSHGEQTGFILRGFEGVLQKENPDAVVVFGDTNTTLAGALAAAKLGIPVAHVEAGLRSYNSSMPEELNRKLTDHVSTWLFCPTQSAIDALHAEGIEHSDEFPSIDSPAVIRTGDIMFDVAKRFASDFESSPENAFILFTLHRNFNTDDPARLTSILTGIQELSREFKVLFPVHPRTQKKMGSEWWSKLEKSGCQLVDPMAYTSLIQSIQKASLVITDSGGVQKEAYFFNKPVIIPRPETEWVEMLEVNCAKCVDANTADLVATVKMWMENPPTEFPPLYGDGRSAELMVKMILSHWKE